MRTRGAAVLLVGALVAGACASGVQTLPDTSPTIDRYISRHLELLATPEFYARKKQRREFQQAGYVSILHEMLGLDPVGALLSYVRTRLQIEYSLPHNTIYFMTDTGALWPLPEDWTFPEDPWADGL